MSFTRADDLLGAWRLDSAVEVFDDGERRDEFGPNPDGYICYNPRRRRVGDTRGLSPAAGLGR